MTAKVWESVMTTEAIVTRLYRSAVLSPNRRVSKRLPNGTRVYLCYDPTANTLNIAVAARNRWDRNSWRDVLSALPIDANEAQSMTKQVVLEGDNYTLFVKDVALTSNSK